MNISKQEFLQYHANTLSEERRKEMDIYLEQHPLEKKAFEGAGLFESTKDLEASLSRISSRWAAKEALTNVPAKTSSKPKFRITWLATISAVAASIVFLIMTFPFGQFGAVELHNYETSYPDILTNIVRGESENSEKSDLVIAMDFYGAMKYDKAAHVLEQLLAEDASNVNIRFYLAICHYELGDYNKALATFEKLTLPSASFAYDDGAQWYKALCLIKLEKTDEAKEVLKTIGESTHYKSETARLLLENYNKIKW